MGIFGAWGGFFLGVRNISWRGDMGDFTGFLLVEVSHFGWGGMFGALTGAVRGWLRCCMRGQICYYYLKNEAWSCYFFVFGGLFSFEALESGCE